jgi:hypothetical protein
MWTALLAFGVLLAGALNSQRMGKPIAKAAEPVLEPKAVELLKAIIDRLAAAHTMAFTALESFESFSGQGHPLLNTVKSELTLQRPDKLRVILSGDGMASEYYYDGKQMMTFAPVENRLAVADAPPTIDAALQAAYDAAGIHFPFTDLILADPEGDAAAGIHLAYYVGQSRQVGNTVTDIVAFAGGGMFAQMWVGAEDKLPRLIHAVYLDDPKQLRHNLVLSNWQLDHNVPADTFGPPNAERARQIPFAYSHPQTQSGIWPRVNGGLGTELN